MRSSQSGVSAESAVSVVVFELGESAESIVSTVAHEIAPAFFNECYPQLRM